MVIEKLVKQVGRQSVLSVEIKNNGLYVNEKCLVVTNKNINGFTRLFLNAYRKKYPNVVIIK